MIRSLFLSAVASLVLGGMLCVLPPSAQSQTLDDVLRYSDPLPATSSNTTGMAGAGLSSGLDAPAALFGNPAGLGWISSSVLSGDFAVNRTRSDTRFSTPNATASSDRAVSDYRIGSIAGAYSFPTTQGSLVIGASFHQSNAYERGFDVLGENRTNSITGTFLPTSDNYDFDGEELSIDDRRSHLAYDAGAIDFSSSESDFFQGANPRLAAANDQLTLEQQENLLESGQMNELSFGLATAIAPNVMFGGSLNIAFGSYTFERFYRETDVGQGQTTRVCSSPGLCPPADPANSDPPFDPYFITDLDGNILLEGFDEMQLEERIDTDLAGVNFRVGLSAEPSDALRVGVRIDSPTWLSADEVYGTEMRTFFDCDFSSGSCVRPDDPYSSGNLTGNEFSYDIRTPWRLGGGLQYSLGNVTVAGDATFIDWTQAEVSADDASFSALNRDLQGLDATVNTRIGLEYEDETFALRTGVAYQPSPLDQSFQDIDGNTTDGDQLFLSAGASVDLNPDATLHLNWLQERFDDRFVSYNSEIGASPTVREALQRNRVLIGLTYRP